jgi:hypothetical protein
MNKNHLTRRELIQKTALAGVASYLGLSKVHAALLPEKTPPLRTEEIVAIEAALGKKGTYKEVEAVHTTALPRNDLKITIKGEAVPISFGFGGWVSLKKTLNGKSTILMSDTVLLQEEVNPLISAAQNNGLEIGAIHNHFFYEEPRVFYMHLHGMGTAEELARKFAATISRSKLLPANQPAQTAGTSATGKEIFDLPALDTIVKNTGAVNGPTYKYTVGRDDLTIMAMGAEMTPSIGLNSWASFAGSRDQAHIAGDIAMLEQEVNPVINTLRKHNLEVVALHHHMLGENPRIIFLHYYGRGPATTLAQGFRAALDQLGKQTKSTDHKKH